MDNKLIDGISNYQHKSTGLQGVQICAVDPHHALQDETVLCLLCEGKAKPCLCHHSQNTPSQQQGSL